VYSKAYSTLPACEIFQEVIIGGFGLTVRTDRRPTSLFYRLMIVRIY
jgi:hypothetical protein